MGGTGSVVKLQNIMTCNTFLLKDKGEKCVNVKGNPEHVG